MTGTWRVLRIVARTSWAVTVLIPLTLIALAWVMAGSIGRSYRGDAARLAYAAVAGPAPVTLLLQGRGYDLDTVGGIFARQMAIIVLTFFLLYASWAGVRLTRTLEDKGCFDVRGWAATWTDPAGWLAEARPFGDDARIWPYLAFLAMTAALGGLTVVLASRRDLGGGIFPALPGRAEARRTLSGVATLLIRLTWRTTAMAAIAGGVVTVVLSSFAQDVAGHGGLDAQLAFLAQLNAEIAALVAVAAVGVMSRQERSGRAGRVLSEPVSRRRWYLDGAIVCLASALLTLLVLAGCSGLALWRAADDPARFIHALTDCLAYYPAVAWCAAVALLLAAIRPGLDAVVWAVVGWAIIVTLPSNVLDLDDAARRLSPVEWIGGVPQHPWNTASAVVMSLGCIAALVAGALRFGRRDLVAG